MFAVLSLIILCAAAYFAFKYRHDVLHPAFWTNLGFGGYALGGFYYALWGFQNAYFLNLAKVDADRESWFVLSTLIVLGGLITCNFAFWLADRRLARIEIRAGSATLVSPFPDEILLLAKIIAIIFLTLGVAYWLYFAHVIAGGVFAQFANVAAYRYLAADAQMSALPFHFAYLGIELWMLLWLFDPRYRSVGLLFIPIGMIIILSTGRIALSNAFGFAAILAYLFATHDKVDWRFFAVTFTAMAPINIAFYFFRQYSSYRYIGRPQDFPLAENVAVSNSAMVATPRREGVEAWLEPIAAPELIGKISYIAKGLIGGGNVPDLQQIILIVKGLLDGRLVLEYGATYVDWIQNLLGSRIGSPNTGIQSTGYRVLEAYFPQKVGGPTPGMIGEAILNFGPLAPFALFAFAFLMTLLYSSAVRSRSVLARLLYCKFLIGIWALFLKVDSSLLLGFLWAAAPIVLCWFGLSLLARLLKVQHVSQLRG